ncbi:hypothetical protein [Nonomuraea endophytica]|uniref:hypothetical protein n=1 Tax=Nonomuraea endophytica TaxID=714136 RepID=UPI0037C6A950
MNTPQVHSHLVFLDSPEDFPLDFHATVSGRTPEEIRHLALDEARNFYGPTLETTGVHVLSTHVVSDPDAAMHGVYRATIVFRQVVD